MPKLQDIEQFKSSLRGLGNETETLNRWGETWQNIEPPPQGVPDDIAALLDSELDEESTAVESPEETIEATSESADFTSFLDELNIEDAPSTEEMDNPADVPEPQDSDDFSVPESLLQGLDTLSEETAEEAVSEDASVDDFAIPEDLSGDVEASAEISLEEPSVEDLSPDASLDDMSLDGMSFDDMPPVDMPPVDMPPEGAPTEADSTIDDFGLGDLEAFAEQPQDSPEGGLESETEDFSVPGFLDEPASVEESTEPVLDASQQAPEDAFDIPEDISSGAEPAGMEDAFDLGSQSLETDSFDQFDLGGGSPPGSSADSSIPDLGAGDFSLGSGLDEMDGQLASLDGETQAADTFSLDADWGGDFSIPGFEMGSDKKSAFTEKTARPGPATAASFDTRTPTYHEEKKARPVELSDAQADALQDTLLSYPLNLRLAVEDIIANSKGSQAQQSDLIWMLVGRSSAKDTAKFAGQILKKYIEVPSGFAKRTGASFEAEKGSLRYIFIHSILPVLQILVLVAVAAGALFYLGYSFIYKPLKANSLYAEGNRQIELTKYSESMEFFEEADTLWPMKSWHYRYAESYAGKKQYPRAEKMYERLLGRWPKETKAALDYARMENATFSFDKADSVLRTYILEWDYFNKDALVLSAENYLGWAEFEEQRYEGPDTKLISDLYAKARLQLATLMEHHGRTDSYLELMLKYLIRTERASGEDKFTDISPLATYFTDNPKSQWSAATLAELAEYLLDRKQTEHVNQILLSAVDRDGALPEAHVAMARWRRQSGFPKDELKALEFATRFYAESELKTGLSTKRTKRYIESLIRLGELHRMDGRSLDAEEAYNNAIEHYEQSLEGLRFKRNKEFGKVYALLADIYYAERMEFPGALSLYSKAEEHDYRTPETDYRRGYIHYMQPSDDGLTSLQLFYRAGLNTDASPYLQWATANALYNRKDYFAAQGYFTALANRLQFELDNLALPSPQTKPSHGEIVELLMMTRNNLGVALYRVAERMGDVRRRADAMYEFTESARLHDSMTRDQTSMLRDDSRNLGFLNLDFVLHPMREIDLVIYKAIPSEMDYPRK